MGYHRQGAARWNADIELLKRIGFTEFQKVIAARKAERQALYTEPCVCGYPGRVRHTHTQAECDARKAVA
jgi:hypothetical protein